LSGEENLIDLLVCTLFGSEAATRIILPGLSNTSVLQCTKQTIARSHYNFASCWTVTSLSFSKVPKEVCRHGVDGSVQVNLQKPLHNNKGDSCKFIIGKVLLGYYLPSREPSKVV